MSIYLWFLTLWRSEFSLAIIFSSAPRKSSCWNAGSNFFLGLKKKMLLFCFHFWRTVSLGWQVFLLLLFPPLSASERCLWSVYNWTRTQLSRLSPSLSFSPSVTSLEQFGCVLLSFSLCFLCLHPNEWLHIEMFLSKFGHLMRFYGFISNLERSAMASNIFLDIRFYPPVWVYPYMDVLPLELYSEATETRFFFPSFCQWYLLRWKNIKIYLSHVRVNNTLLTIVAMADSGAAEFLLPGYLKFPVINISPEACAVSSLW